MTETLSPEQRRTRPAHEAFLSRFPDPESRSQYFRDLAKRSHAKRITLSAGDADMLRQVYHLLGTKFERETEEGAAHVA